VVVRECVVGGGCAWVSRRIILLIGRREKKLRQEGRKRA